MRLPKLPCICISAIILAGCSGMDSESNSSPSESKHKKCLSNNPFCSGNCSCPAPDTTPIHATQWHSSEARFDEELKQELVKSKDITSDIKRMWKTVPHDEFPVSPVSAINAASRVFESVQLKGKTKAEVFALIGNNKTSNDSGYNFPFWEAQKDDLVYRFDCGNFGWQFNLEFNGTDRVTEVKRMWIH